MPTTAHDINIRDANDDDCALIFKWRNDPWIISLSSHKKTVSFDEHQQWYENALRDDDIHIFIINIDGQACGLIRFNRASESESVITIYLLKPHTGKGYGPKAMQMGCDAIQTIWDISYIHADILRDNTPSHEAFKKVGFSKSTSASPHHDHDRYTYEVAS